MKSEIKQIVIDRTEHNFDKAFERAYDDALWKFKIDDSGHCEDRDSFPRSESSLVVEFVSCTHSGGMGGQSIVYIYSAYMERCEDD